MASLKIPDVPVERAEGGLEAIMASFLDWDIYAIFGFN
jgi:hypothetical protein